MCDSCHVPSVVDAPNFNNDPDEKDASCKISGDPSSSILQNGAFLGSGSYSNSVRSIMSWLGDEAGSSFE